MNSILSFRLMNEPSACYVVVLLALRSLASDCTNTDGTHQESHQSSWVLVGLGQSRVGTTEFLLDSSRAALLGSASQLRARINRTPRSATWRKTVFAATMCALDGDALRFARLGATRRVIHVFVPSFIGVDGFFFSLAPVNVPLARF